MNYKKWLNENIGDLSGKIYIVTGATGTLGTEITRNLLNLNASVIMAVRNIEKARLLIANFKKDSSTSFVRAYALDLTSFSSIETFCTEMLADYTQIDALIHNAGIYHLPKITVEGYDIHYMVNYLAPLKLTELLRPLLTNGKAIFVTSLAQTYAKIDSTDLQSLKTKNKTKIYGRSKLLLSNEVQKLQEQYSKPALTLCHPGIFSSELFSAKDGRYSKTAASVIRYCMKIIFNASQKSSLNILYAIKHTIPNGYWVGPRVIGIWGLPQVKKI